MNAWHTYLTFAVKSKLMINEQTSESKLPTENSGKFSFFQSVLTLTVGFATGVAAGLIGVGGGEFRMPYLMWLFKKNAKTAAAVNLIVGCFTVVFAFFKRWKSFAQIHTDDWILGVVFILASLIGSYFGVRKVRLISNRIISAFIYIYLIVVGLWMLYEAVSQTDITSIALSSYVKYTFAVVTGFLIAAISVGIGVAGGEMRIPLLMYLFSLPIKTAGTISLLVSIPTVFSGALTYRSYGYLPLKSIIIAVIMSVGSLSGIILGVYFLGFADKHTLKAILGSILLLASLMLILPGFHKRN